MESCPFEIDDRDLAICARAERLQELARSQRGDIALALQLLFFRIHGVGYINRDHKLDVHGDCAGAIVGEARRRGGKSATVAAGQEADCRQKRH
jgi:hypothetical protein